MVAHSHVPRSRPALSCMTLGLLTVGCRDALMPSFFFPPLSLSVFFFVSLSLLSMSLYVSLSLSLSLSLCLSLSVSLSICVYIYLYMSLSLALILSETGGFERGRVCQTCSLQELGVIEPSTPRMCDHSALGVFLAALCEVHW